MPSNVIPMPQSPTVVPQDWVWDGTKWVCTDVPPACQIPPWGPWAPPWFGPQAPPWYPGANGGIAFSDVAPQFPIRGHFWWNGVVLALFDGAEWVNTNTGAIIAT
jgi:hypothetical protein